MSLDKGWLVERVHEVMAERRPYPGRARRIDITVHRKRLPRFKYREVLPGVRLHTVRRSPRPDEVRRQFGVRVTSPARTIVDAAEAGVDPGYIVDAVAQALKQGVVTGRDLKSAATDRARRVRDLIERAEATASRSTRDARFDEALGRRSRGRHPFGPQWRPQRHPRMRWRTQP